MTNDKPQVGDKVRVTDVYEGVVDFVDEHTVTFVNGKNFYKTFGYSDRTIEILERAKPKWQNGDVADSPRGIRYAIGGKWVGGNGQVHWHELDEAPSTFRLVMRDGKPV